MSEIASSPSAPRKDSKTVIGLTGPLGSGKSTVGSLLRKRGFTVFEADALGRELLLTDPETQAEIARRFGPSVLSNGIPDPTKLRDRIFQNEADRQALEEVVHPRVLAQFQKAAESISPVFFESALLPSLRFPLHLDSVMAVLSPLEIARNRVMASKGWSQETAEMVQKSQPPIESYRAMATVVLENQGSLAALEEALEEALKELGLPSGGPL